VMKLNVEHAQNAIAVLARRIAARTRDCACPHALKNAIITDRAVIPPKIAAELRPIIGKYT